MRVEPDRQGHHRSEAPACHRCGAPLLDGATMCPFCECTLDTRAHNRAAGRVARLITQRAALSIGFVFFAAVAIVCMVAAFVV